MLDCLPDPNDWSPASQYAFLQDHLEAMQHHLRHLQTAAHDGLNALETAQHHFQELQQRGTEAHQQLIQLLQLPSDQRAALAQQHNRETHTP